ncbi:hypothetical protein MGYG_04634 [Nannizzia gypsea CBS 118893]|uniref:Aminoglycoside phosphotransferase domain-containing protein n=1 Tax=Arthroderma gypseum (strain ATCC MYA-4604 / CBS 118893) TaxID=535722 RepID=E4UVX1_ARTGP|nr:hypothetical protein MGYG_04634 [Nannizzia gypsea CBS 118893]EFR01632.1 hypothetical protein MGYG_04634 [Nannizzia gypsea CBS 118893]
MQSGDYRLETSTYEKHHEICFTDSDLNLSNRLLQGGKLSGLIDWKNAGFKPEYWEYTRTAWACLGNERAEAELDYAFDMSYHDELKAQKLLWMAKPVY